MILIDTSIWIQIFGRRPPKGFHTDLLLESMICPPILQEVLQGIREEKNYLTLKDRLLALPIIEEAVALETYLSAADLFRAGRKRGLTIQSSMDCLIAAIAIKHRAPVWHSDRDFRQIARFTSLELYRAN